MNTEKTKVQFIDISDDIAGQRIDNFLRNRLKNIPKSMIYRVLRKGEVRVNKKRIKPEYKLQEGDVIRLPPMQIPETTQVEAPNTKLNRVAELEKCVIYEDDHMLILNKPPEQPFMVVVVFILGQSRRCVRCVLMPVFLNWCIVLIATRQAFC